MAIQFKSGVFTFDQQNKLIIPDSDQTTIFVQDVYNACREAESEPMFIDELDIVKAGGKDDLGDGAFVGITMTLLNDWRVKFADQPGPTVEPRFIRGGNTLAINSFANNPVAPSTFVAVTIAQDSSPTLIETGVSGLTADESLKLDQMHGMTERSIYFDDTAGAGGAGYQQDPVSSINEIVSATSITGIRHVKADSDITLDRNMLQYQWDGRDQLHTMDLAGWLVADSSFMNLKVTGDGVSSDVFMRGCALENLLGVKGSFHDCGFEGTITPDGTGKSVFHNCYSEVPGLTRPILSFSDSAGAMQVALRSWSGGLEIASMTQTNDECSIEVESGRILIATSCTNGLISVRGIGYLTNDSAGTTVDVTGFVDASDITKMRKLLQNRMETNPTTGVMTIYDDDDTTVLFTGNIFEDVAATQIYRGRGIERRNRLT
jgi:hypothetical protein